MTEAMPSTTSTTIIPPSAQNRSLSSSPVRMQGKSVSPRPVGTSSFSPYVTGFTMPTNDREQPYGMPTSTMEILHNRTSTFTDPRETIISPLQRSGLAVNNLGRSTRPSGVGVSG